MNEENPHREFEAIITRVKNFGIYFEIIDLLLEGFLHISELEEDFFVFEEEQMRLRGTRHGTLFTAGDRLTVSVQNIDFIAQETNWYLVSRESSNLSLKEKKHLKRQLKKQVFDLLTPNNLTEKETIHRTIDRPNLNLHAQKKYRILT